MRASLRIASVFVGLALASAACGDDTGGEGGSGSGGDATSSTGSPSTGTEATSSTGDTGTTTGSSGTGGEAPECEFPSANTTDPLIREFETLSGTVMTTDGEPVADSAIQVCGINLCLYGDTDANGEVTVPQGSTPLDVPVFKVGDGLELAKIGYPLPDDGGEVVIDATTIELLDSGTTMEAGAEAQADGVVLTIAADGLVGLNTLEFGDPGQDTFRAAVLPTDLIETVAPGEDFVAVVGVGPHETLFCPPAGLSVPNGAGLAAGAEVEFVQQGLETGQYFGDYGVWTSVATGHVSDDGSMIETDEGQGIPIISTVGIRPL